MENTSIELKQCLIDLENEEKKLVTNYLKEIQENKNKQIELKLKIKKTLNLEKLKFKKYFFLDSENIASVKDLKNIIELNENDVVYFFYGHDYWSKEALLLLLQTKAKIIYIPVTNHNHNGMDLEIVRVMTECVRNKKKGSFILLSKDNGYNISLQILSQKTGKDITIAKTENFDFLDVTYFEKIDLFEEIDLYDIKIKSKSEIKLEEIKLEEMKLEEIKLEEINLKANLKNLSITDKIKLELYKVLNIKNNVDIIYNCFVCKNRPTFKLQTVIKNMNISKKNELSILYIYTYYLYVKSNQKCRNIKFENFIEISKFIYNQFGDDFTYNRDLIFKIANKNSIITINNYIEKHNYYKSKKDNNLNQNIQLLINYN